MVNNFKQIKKLLDFRTKDDFYFIQILQRKKDHNGGKVNGSNNNSRLIKAYYVHSLEYLDFIEPEIIELCNIFNARAGVNLNRRSYEKMALQHLRKVTDQIINKSFNKSHKAYASVAGAYNNDVDKKWILDIDNNENGELEIKPSIIFKTVNNSLPEGGKIIDVINSKNGIHIITKPFNSVEFKIKFPDIEIHKNNPTNLYIP